LYVTQFSLGELTFYSRVLKSTACMALIHEAADKIRTMIFFKSFSEKKINELVIASNKLTNSFAGLVTSGLGLNVACRPPVGPHWFGYINLLIQPRLEIRIKIESAIIQASFHNLAAKIQAMKRRRHCCK
jgi:hypothetical protein